MLKDTHRSTSHVGVICEWYLFGNATAECFTLALLTEHLELVDFIVAKRIAIARFAVVWRQLIQQLLDSILFAYGVDIRNFVIVANQAKILMHLFAWNPELV